MICPTNKKFGGGQDNTMLNALLNGRSSASPLPLFYNDEVTNLRATSPFAYCYINEVWLTELLSIGTATSYIGSAFKLSKIKKIFLPKLQRVYGIETFREGIFRLLYIPKAIRLIGEMQFYNNSSLKSIIIEGKCELTANQNVGYTPFASNGSGGIIYTNYGNESWYLNEEQHWATMLATNVNNQCLSIQENLATLYGLGVPIEDYRLIVTELPTEYIDDTKTYFILDSGTTYHQWFHGSGSWEQLSDITL